MNTPLVAKYYTTEEVARILNCKPGTVREMAQRGEFEGVKRIGRQYRIPKHVIDPPVASVQEVA